MNDFDGSPFWLNPPGDPYLDLERQRSYLEEGLRHYSAGNLEKALDCWEKAIALKPDDDEAWNNKGVVLRKLGKCEEAVNAYNKALEIKPNKHETWSNKGNVLYYDLGRYEEALTAYDKARKLKPDDHEAWSDKGYVLNALGRYEEAIAAFDKTIEIKPDYDDAWLNKGNALRDLGRYEEALAAYDKVIELKPDYYGAWHNKGNVLRDLGRYEETLAAYDKAIELKPDYYGAWYNKGNVLRDLDRYEEALAAYDKAIEIKSDYYDAWGSKGDALSNLGRYEEALAAYDRAIKIKPDNDAAWNNKGNVLSDLDRYEEALAAYDKAIEVKSDHYAAWYNKGNALGNLGRYEEALAAYDKALEIKPDYHETWYNKGDALGNLGRYEEALVAYDKALEIKPDDYGLWNSKGNALGNLGRYEEALAAYDKAIEIKSDYYGAWYNKGIVLYALGRYEEALAAYDKAIEIKPDYHDAWGNKGDALSNLGRYEEALAAYDRAIKIKPDDYGVWNSKGNALSNLGRYEEAIAACDKAIELKLDYHGAWCGKGNALSNLGRYDEAIAAYDKALEIKPDLHEAWSNKGNVLSDLDRYDEALAAYNKALEASPGFHWAWYRKGWALRELGRYDEALAAYDKALEIKPDLAWNNKGIVLRDLGRYDEAFAACDKALQLEPDCYYAWGNKGITLNKLERYPEALENFNEAEKFTERPDEEPNWEIWQHRGWTIYELHGYDAAIEHWNQGLQHFQSDTRNHQKGRGFLRWQMAKASDRRAQQQTDSRPLLYQAKSSYEQARKILTSEDFPQQHLEVLQELTQVCQKLGNFQDAKVLTLDGAALLRQLLQKTDDNRWKIELSRKFASFKQWLVDEIAFSPYPRQKTIALELAEEHKNLCLAWMERGFVESSSSNFRSPKYPEIQTLLDSQTAAIYWHLSPAAITVFLLRNSKPPQVIKKNQPLSFWRRDIRELLRGAKPTAAVYLAASKQLQEFQQWMKRWRESYDEYRDKKKPSNNSQWRKGMEAELEKLREILDSDRLLPLLKDVDRLILIPHRDLHLLPLHYLFPERFTISYLPSAKVGLEMADSTPQTTPENLLSIEKTAKDLPYAAVESAVIGKQFSTRSLAGNDATIDGLKKQLETPAEIFHFTGHSLHDSDRPSQSELYLANGSLTLEHLFRLDKVAINFLVYLSSCETGMTGTEGLINEFVGLASGFLAKGAKYVISTLWRVPEISTAMLTIRFYQLYNQGKTPVIALKEAQNWLRGATYQQLIELYNRLAAELEADAPSCAEALEAAADVTESDANIKGGDFRPYTHPYYWAGFIVTGKV